MNTKKPHSIYGATDPRDLPAYGIVEAAHYLGIPKSTLRAWVLGQRNRAGRDFRPVIEPADKDTRLLSFFNLIEAHVLDALRRKHEIPLQKVRPALEYLRKLDTDKHPLASNQFATSGLELFVEKYGALVNLSKQGQMEMKEFLIAYLKRVERDSSGLPIRLYPYTRKKALDEPRAIVIDPLIAFGRPIVSGTGVPTAVIADRYKAGESLSDLAADYEVQPWQVEEAIRCEFQAA